MTRDGAFHAQRYAQGDDAQQHVVAAPVRDRPLLSGEPRDLWIGAGLIVLAFLAVIAFLMVWRVGGASARRKKRNAELFQPAGEGAEITFDDEPSASQPSAKEMRERRKREKAERAAAVKAAKSGRTEKTASAAEEHAEDAPRAADEAEVVIERARPAEEPSAPQPKKSERRSQPFAALFSRRKKAEPYVSGTLDLGAENPASDQMRLHPLAGERRRPRDDERSEPETAEAAPDTRRPVRAEAEQAHRLAERLEEERRQERTRLEAAEEMRRKAIDEARLVAERQQNEIEISRRAEAARLQAEAEAREEARRRNYEREAEFERRKQLAAIEQRERDMRRADSAETLRRELSQELERKVEALAARLPDRAMQAQQFAEPLPADPALLRAVDRIARDLAQQRTALDEAVGALSARIDEIGAASRDTDGLRQEMAGLKRALNERFSGPSAPMMQLEDILRNALPPDAYDLRVMLSNNRKADCLVRLPNPPGPVVIDGRFPVEAFQKLHMEEGRDQSAAENEFRRTALRHIVDIAERLIIPGETGDSALMFLPSESMHTELLARFQDLVQDSYRARVWIVSPTTLMATLHTMRAVMRETPKAPAPEVNDAQQVMAEVDALRRRVLGLESSVDRVRHDMRDLVGVQEQTSSQTKASAFMIEPMSASATPAVAASAPVAPSPGPPPFLTSAPVPAPPVQAAPVQLSPMQGSSGHGHANGAAPPPMQSQPSAPAAAPASQPAPPPERPAPAFLLPPVPPVR